MQQFGADRRRQWSALAAGAWVKVVAARPMRTLFGLALIVTLATVAATRLSIDTDSSRMLSAGLPFQQRINALNDAFPALKNTVVVVVRSNSADAADAAVGALSEALARRTDVFEWVFAPSVDRNLVAHGLLYLDRESLDARLSRLGKSANLLANLREDQTLGGFLRALDSATGLARRPGGDASALEALYAEATAVLAANRQGQTHAFGWSSALAGASDGPVMRVITARPELDFRMLNPARPALQTVDGAVAALDPQLVRDVEIGVTGELALRADELTSVTERIGLSLVLSLLFVAILLRLALGSIARAALALAALLVTLVLTAGFAAQAVGALNLISIAFVVLMVGLGIDFSIHYVANFDEHASEYPDRVGALVGAAHNIGTALVLSAATTSLAFLAFATTDFIGMAQLGLIGGVGVLIALAVTLTAIPAAISRWPVLANSPPPRKFLQPPAAVRRLLVGLALGAGLAGAMLAPQARFDADPMNLRNSAAGSVQAYGWLAEDPALAPLRLSVLVSSAGEARATASALADLAEVESAQWLGDLVPDDQPAKLDLIDLAYPSLLHAVEGPSVELNEAATPVTAEILAQNLDAAQTPAAVALAVELRAYATRASPAVEAEIRDELFRYFPLLVERLRLQLDASEVTAEMLPAPLRDRYSAPDGRLRVEVSSAADLRDPVAMGAFVRAVSTNAPGAGGPPDQIIGAAGSVAGAILQASALAFAGCALLAWFMLRDIALATAILLPLLLAGAVTAGASVVLNLPFNYANIIVLPLLIGIGIDSGVHFALRASNARGSVFDTATPRAVLYSALTTVAAFGTLGLSDHPGTASMGILLAIALASAVGMIFALTPFVIRLLRPLRDE